VTAKEFQAHYGRGQPTQAAPAKGTPTTTGPSKPSPANELTKAAIQLLRLYGVHIWRQNNGAVYDASFGGYRAGSTTRGISDTIGYFKATGRCSRAAGRFAAVEIKVGRDTLSPEQIEFLAGVKAAGGFACECRDLTQLETELKNYLSTLP
jgi:hypothetical protein